MTVMNRNTASAAQVAAESTSLRKRYETTVSYTHLTLPTKRIV